MASSPASSNSSRATPVRLPARAPRPRRSSSCCTLSPPPTPRRPRRSCVNPATPKADIAPPSSFSSLASLSLTLSLFPHGQVLQPRFGPPQPPSHWICTPSSIHASPEVAAPLLHRAAASTASEDKDDQRQEPLALTATISGQTGHFFGPARRHGTQQARPGTG
ncbi:hypothetical protein VPH35_078057 [Triticum aestivum]